LPALDWRGRHVSPQIIGGLTLLHHPICGRTR